MALRLYIYLPFVFVALTIFFLSSQSHLPVVSVIEFQDKIMHFLAFFGLGYTMIRICFYKRVSKLNSIVITIGVCTIYGLSDEIHQTFVPNRVFDWADLFADFLGCATASLFASHFYRLDIKLKRAIARG